jgi:cysteinyl-tRNA synthetase
MAATTAPAATGAPTAGPAARPSAGATPPPSAAPATPSPSASPTGVGPGRGFPAAGPWLSFYGAAEDLGDLAAIAARYRILNVDADPDQGNFTPAQLATLRAGGKNRVLGYLNLGAVETWRDYWATAPAGLTPARDLRTAQLGPYQGYDDEVWMDPRDPGWRRLLLEHVAPRLVAQGIDGFYFDNMELLSHGAADPAGGACEAACAEAGLSLVRDLRAKWPDLLFVMQNGTGPATRAGMVDGTPFPALLDGVAHESVFTQPSGEDDAEDDVYTLETDAEVLAELRAWGDLGLTPGGRPFWLGAMEYVNACTNRADAARVKALAEDAGLAPAIADRSAGLAVVCDWGW